MSGTLTPWSDIRARLHRLSPQRRAAFALVCAEHLLSSSATETAVGLRRIVDDTWTGLTSGQVDAGVARQLFERDDADADEVAAVAYALRAVSGHPEDAWWAVSRCMDAAFDRIAYPDDATTFRPLEIDAATPEVQQELQWQLNALNVVEEPGELDNLVRRLRALA